MSKTQAKVNMNSEHFFKLNLWTICVNLCLLKSFGKRKVQSEIISFTRFCSLLCFFLFFFFICFLHGTHVQNKNKSTIHINHSGNEKFRCYKKLQKQVLVWIFFFFVFLSEQLTFASIYGAPFLPFTFKAPNCLAVCPGKNYTFA